MGVFNELQKIWSRIRGIEQRLEGYDEVVIVSALPTNPIDGVMYQFNGNFYYHLNGTWHIAVTVPSDVNQLTDTSGLFTGVPITAEDLETLMDAGELVPGRNYIITDFAQAYNIFDGGTMNIEEEKIGTAEVLFVKAVSTTKLHHEARSAMRPQDIIHFSLKLLDDRDIGFGDGAGTPCANFKGMIYYRKDTVQNVETHYDFRHIKFRRWAVDAELYEDGAYATYTGQVSGMTTDVTLTADTIGVVGNTISLVGDGVKTIAALISDWNSTYPANTVTVTAGDDTQIPDEKVLLTLDGGVDPKSYVPRDVCKSAIDGKIYKCITATTGEGDPTVNTADWILWLDITADAFVSWTADKAQFNIGDINTDNLIINNVTAGVDYDDFYTFGDYYNWVKDVSLGGINLDLQIDNYGSATILLSQKVFKTTDVLYTCCSIKFGDNNLPMTFGNCIYSMTFGNDNRSMIFRNYNRSMIFGDDNHSMTFGNNNYSMTFGNKNHSMTFGDNNSMTFGDNNYSMTFRNSNSKMKFRDVTNPENRMITFGDGSTMCVFEDNCFIGLASDLDLSAATHIRGTYNTTIYQDKTNGVKLSYMDGGVMQIVDVTA